MGASSYESVWTTRGGDQLVFSSLEFISFVLVILPDGSPAPDFSQPSTPQIFQTLKGGNGRFANAQGVTFAEGTFDPTSPNTVAAAWKGIGSLSRCGH